MLTETIAELDLSFVQLVLEASLLVQMVMLLLLLISIFSWTLILRKSRYLKKVRKAADNFEDNFWKFKDLNALYNRICSYDDEPKGMESIFTAGYMEFVRLRKQPNMTPHALLEGSRRAMRVALHREMNELEAHLAALASVGSVSPYIGLFGTVWGIMNSFQALGGIQQATLAMVAPGISEALIATAMGLFAAIPAVMAYNHYVDDVDRLTTRYETFLEEFTGILQRQAHTTVNYPPPAPASA
ncbi:MAG: protein TolQ [Candidatus Parabeggiatoa sp. nov. 2]|nr:MAG: protein TolQ [Gammaproteobacteria bacterium]